MELIFVVVYPVGWGCRIYQLFLCRGVRHPKSVLDITLNNLVMLELWGMQSTPSLPLFPGSLWPKVGATDWVLSMGQIKLNCILMLNWIVWNRTVFDIETVLFLNWIAWNKTVLIFNCV